MFVCMHFQSAFIINRDLWLLDHTPTQENCCSPLFIDYKANGRSLTFQWPIKYLSKDFKCGVSRIFYKIFPVNHHSSLTCTLSTMTRLHWSRVRCFLLTTLAKVSCVVTRTPALSTICPVSVSQHSSSPDTRRSVIRVRKLVHRDTWIIIIIIIHHSRLTFFNH